MTNNDEFDVDLELENDVAEDFAEEAGFEEEQPVKTKKSGGGFGGFLVKFLLLLVLIAGGLFASVKYLGVQLPFDVPYLNELAGVQPAPAPAPNKPAAPQTASVDLSAETPQPAAMEAVGGWEDDPTATAGADSAHVMTGDVGVMDDFAADNSTTQNTGLDEFGLPPSTEGATDLSATTGTGFTDDWGVTPAAPQDTQQADTSAVAAADEFFGTPATPADTPVTAPVVETEVAAPVTSIKAPAETAAVAATADTAAVKALEKKIGDLEKSLADLRKNTATKADIDALKASLAKIEKAAAAAPAATTKTESVKAEKTETKAAAPEEAKPAPVKKATTTATKTPVARKSWVLRSAKPGMAWISEKGSGEIKTIAVGDTVTGIGKVTAIAKDDSGRWVVSGTQGKINQ